MTLLHVPSIGWQDIDTSIDALFGDALACEAEHADRLYRRFCEFAECDWQRAVVEAGPVDIPDEPPDTPPGGPEPPDPWRSPAAPPPASAPSPLDMRGGAHAAAAAAPIPPRSAGWLARAQWAQVQVRQWPSQQRRAA